MIKCILVDDEPLALAQLKGYVERSSLLQCVGAFASATEVVDFLSNNDDVDVMFVDIEMPDMSGLDMVKSLSSPPKVVFTTAYSEYAIDGFRVDAVDYLLKPFSFEEFNKAVNKVCELCKLEQSAKSDSEVLDKDDDTIFVKSDYKVIRIPIHAIKYVESLSEYVRIYVEGEQKGIVTLLSMKRVEETLPKSSFMRVHRSYIVNLNKVKEVSRMRIVFDNNVFIPIGDMYKDNFFDYIDRHFIGKKYL